MWLPAHVKERQSTCHMSRKRHTYVKPTPPEVNLRTTADSSGFGGEVVEPGLAARTSPGARPACRGFLELPRRPSSCSQALSAGAGPDTAVSRPASALVPGIQSGSGGGKVGHDVSATQRLQSLREGLLPAPGRQAVGARAPGVFGKFVDAVGQITQSGQHLGRTTMSDAAVILSEGDIAPVMGSVLARRPVATDLLSEFDLAHLLGGQATGVESDFRGRRGVGGRQRDRFTEYSSHLPATDQSYVLRRGRRALEPPTFQPIMVLFPLRRVRRGERPAGRADVRRVRGYRPDCL